MGWTKRAIVEGAYAELALAGYDYDLTPEELEWARGRLDLMLATWSAKGLRLPYAQGQSPTDGDLDDASGLPLYAVEAAQLQLAIRISAGKGKQLAAATRQSAHDAYTAMLSKLASEQVREQQMPSGVPRGQGQKPWRTVNQPYFQAPDTSPLAIGPDGGLEFHGKAD